MFPSELATFLLWLRKNYGDDLSRIDVDEAAKDYAAWMDSFDCHPGERIPSQPRDEAYKEEHNRAAAGGITYQVPYRDATIR